MSSTTDVVLGILRVLCPPPWWHHSLKIVIHLITCAFFQTTTRNFLSIRLHSTASSFCVLFTLLPTFCCDLLFRVLSNRSVRISSAMSLPNQDQTIEIYVVLFPGCTFSWYFTWPTIHMFVLYHYKDVVYRDSLAGQALDWRSKCLRFGPGSVYHLAGGVHVDNIVAPEPEDSGFGFSHFPSDSTLGNPLLTEAYFS